MMLTLLICCYATGWFGSRTIEAATYSDVAVRYLCANRHPDHDSICTFRTAYEPAFVAAFTHPLHLAHQLRLTQLGGISVDGTKIVANASKQAVSYQRAGEMIAQSELEAQELMTRAKQADAQATKPSGLDIPAELRRREQRVAASQRARQGIEKRAKRARSRAAPSRCGRARARTEGPR